jgi:hypothetical protein
MKIDLTRDIMLRRLPNGGWVVKQRNPESGLMTDEVAAFTSHESMLDVLLYALGDAEDDAE